MTDHVLINQKLKKIESERETNEKQRKNKNSLLNFYYAWYWVLGFYRGVRFELWCRVMGYGVG